LTKFNLRDVYPFRYLGNFEGTRNEMCWIISCYLRSNANWIRFRRILRKKVAQVMRVSEKGQSPSRRGHVYHTMLSF